MIIVNYIFYRLFKLAKRTEKQWSPNIRMPYLMAFYSFTILQFINIYTILVILSKGLNLFDLPSPLRPIHTILSCCLLLIINYFMFLNKRKYLSLEKKLDEKVKNKKGILNNIFFWSYVIGTFPIFFLSLILLSGNGTD